MGAAIDNLLPRLNGLRQTAPDRWIARCPAHDDRGPSLSVRAVDGKVLLRCFAGCTWIDICGALGIGTRELFDDRREWRPSQPANRVPAEDILALVDEDVLAASIVAADFLAHRTISEADWDLLAVAARRLGRAAREIQYRRAVEAGRESARRAS